VGYSYQQPDINIQEVEKGESARTSTIGPARSWEKANLTICLLFAKNCEEGVRSHIDSIEDASESWKVLQELYEGKSITDHSGLLVSLTKFSFDDRIFTINDHIFEYEQRWNIMWSIIVSSPHSSTNNGITIALRAIARCDEAKGEFLLQSLPSFYSNTVENIKSKEKYAYGDVVVKLREYIPARQNGRKPEKPTPTISDQVVLATRSGRVCKYCQSNGWPGKGHDEKDCRTKKRENKKKEANSIEIQEDTNSGLECLVINSELNASVGATYANSRQSLHDWQYDDGASIHTTNNFKKLINPKIQKTFITGHDGSGSYATHIGNAEIKQHGRAYILTNVHYAPQFSNLISGQRLL
jgi:hypothetical protein